MALDFQGYELSEIVNPNPHSTRIVFTSTEDPDITKKSLILLDRQIKYIEIDEHQRFKRVKVYVTGDEEAISVDFKEKDMDKFILFLESLNTKLRTNS